MRNSDDKIAIIGNMNNNGFALMRYFRDLGANAYLLPFSTDGHGNLSHFLPEDDTWNLEYWNPYIQYLNIPNTNSAVLRELNIFRSILGFNTDSKAYIEYNYCIGSGIAPALFEVIGCSLDIYYPYATGIEFYGDIEFRSSKNKSLAHKVLYHLIKRLQSQGISNSRYCLNAEMSLTSDSFFEIGRTFEPLAVPLVYNRESLVNTVVTNRLSSIINRLQSANFSVFCCSRLVWVKKKNISEYDWNNFSKNSDWLFHGFAQFIRDNPNSTPLLVIVEYGPDVVASQQLVQELNISQYVVWLPIMPRREIMLLLKVCNIGVGEFYTSPGALWGGTGWEVLASGKPLLQSYNFKNEEFQTTFGYPPPPILDVKSSIDISSHLSNMYNNKHQAIKIGRDSLRWFNNYNGIELAKKWLDLLTKE